jgi:hypothetical protein
MNKDLLIKTFRNTTGAIIYIFLVSQVMQNGGKLFGENDNFFTPFVVLLIFCFSAAVVGGLVFGQSVILYLDNKKTESIKAAIYSIGWLGIYTILGFLTLIIIK